MMSKMTDSNAIRDGWEELGLLYYKVFVIPRK